MRVKDILKRKGTQVVTIGCKATLHTAVCKLVENKVGALPVEDDSGRLLGILTERDIMREVYSGSPLRTKLVSEVMTRDIVTGSPEDGIEYVMNEMTERRFRHMPVIQEGELVGIVSIGDIVKAQLDHSKTQVTQLMDYVAGPIGG